MGDTAKEDVKRKFLNLQTKILKEENGEITLDLTEAQHGSIVAKALDAIERASWRSPDGKITEEMEILIMQANIEIKTYEDESIKNKLSVDSSFKLRSTIINNLNNITFHFQELSNVIKNNIILESNVEIQNSLRLSTSAISYITSRMKTKITSAWINNDEIESETSALEEVRSYIDQLDLLVIKQSEKSDQNVRDNKLINSTLELALSKLESLTRIISDTGTNKNTQVQKAIEDAETYYLQVKRKYISKHDMSGDNIQNDDQGENNQSESQSIDASITDELMKKISEAESIAKKISEENLNKLKFKDESELKIRKLQHRLDLILGMIDASGSSLVNDKLEEMILKTKQSVNNVIRFNRRSGNENNSGQGGGGDGKEGSGGLSKLDVLIKHANEDCDELDKFTIEVKELVNQAEEEYQEAKIKLDKLSSILRNMKNKAETYEVVHYRNVSTVLHEGELALKIVKMNMLGTSSWLNDNKTIKALLDDLNIKVELCEEEIDREIETVTLKKQEEDMLGVKYRQLQKRHEKVCTSLELLKTAPPPRLLQAISNTDKLFSEMISILTSSSLSRLEVLIKEEEEFLDVDVHESENKLLELEKVATMVPVFLTKLAHLDASVEAAGVQVASLVEVELGEAHRIVRSIEHSLDTGTLPSISIKEVSGKVLKAEQAVSTHVRSVSNAMKAQEEIKSQLLDLQLSYDELVEQSALFWAKSSSQTDVDPSSSSSSGDSMNQSRISLSMRIINQAMKRSEQLLSHARRRIEVPINVWIEYGPSVAQQAIENSKDGIKSAKLVLDNEIVKLESNDLERRQAKARLEECSNTLITLRAMVDSFEDCSDLSPCYDIIDNTERSIEVGLRVLNQGTVSSSLSAIEISIKKTKEAEVICNNVIQREEKNNIERLNIIEMLNKEKEQLTSLKETINFLELNQEPHVIDCLSIADRAVIGVDLVIKCEFGLTMLRKEFQLCKSSIESLNTCIDSEKLRLEIEMKKSNDKKLNERSLKQKLIENERMKVMKETYERREMQDKLEEAIHRLQLYWPAVIDVQNSMQQVESSVETARNKLQSGGLASANAAVSSALSKVSNLEQIVMNIDAQTNNRPTTTSWSSSSSPSPSTERRSANTRPTEEEAPSEPEEEANMGLLETNLKEVNDRIEKQNKIMSIQYKLIMASSSDADSSEQEALRKELEALQN